MPGFGELQTPRDLLQKLQHEFAALTKDPSNQYLAFNFFITGYHILDWLHPGLNKAAKDKRDKLESQNVELQIASHIANGSKHFVAEAKKHQSVKSVNAPEGAFQANAFQADAFQTDELEILLDGPAAARFGQIVHVVKLGKALLDFWEEFFQRNGL